MRRIIAGLCALGLLTGCGSSLPAKPAAPSSAATVAVSGTIALATVGGFRFDGAVGDDGDGSPCSGISGFSDINAGASVVIADDSGKTLALTTLGSGMIAAAGCVFPFTTTVPAGLKFYGVTVSHRGTVKEAEADLGSIALTLGN